MKCLLSDQRWHKQPTETYTGPLLPPNVQTLSTVMQVEAIIDDPEKALQSPRGNEPDQPSLFNFLVPAGVPGS